MRPWLRLCKQSYSARSISLLQLVSSRGGTWRTCDLQRRTAGGRKRRRQRSVRRALSARKGPNCKILQCDREPQILHATLALPTPPVPQDLQSAALNPGGPQPPLPPRSCLSFQRARMRVAVAGRIPCRSPIPPARVRRSCLFVARRMHARVHTHAPPRPPASPCPPQPTCSRLPPSAPPYPPASARPLRATRLPRHADASVAGCCSSPRSLLRPRCRCRSGGRRNCPSSGRRWLPSHPRRSAAAALGRRVAHPLSSF